MAVTALLTPDFNDEIICCMSAVDFYVRLASVLTSSVANGENRVLLHRYGQLLMAVLCQLSVP